MVQSRYTPLGASRCGRPSPPSSRLVVRSQSGFGQDGDTGKKAGPRAAKTSKKTSKKTSTKTSKRGKESSRKDPNVQLQDNIREFEAAARAAGAPAEREQSYVDNVVDLDLDASSGTSYTGDTGDTSIFL